MSLSANDITIAITVFNRRHFLKKAIGSALDQSAPVWVIVVEDCGPDTEMESFVRREFGARIEYFRNARRRGLFDNWNACLEYCPTPWLSILHDDDYLAPNFVQAMLDLSREAPSCGLYFGETPILNDAGEVVPCVDRPAITVPWRRVDLADTLPITPFPFPGHVFNVEFARALGGFNKASQYCGDWQMWCNLIASYGGAQTRATVGYNCSHGGLERGTSKIFRNGRLRPLTFVQQKRILNLLRQKQAQAGFNRAEFLRQAPMSIRYLLQHGSSLTPRLFRYNVGLLLRSTAPNKGYAVFQAAARTLGIPFVKAAGQICRLLFRSQRANNTRPSPSAPG